MLLRCCIDVLLPAMIAEIASIGLCLMAMTAPSRLTQQATTTTGRKEAHQVREEPLAHPFRAGHAGARRS